MTLKNTLIALPAIFLLHACSGDSNHDFQPGKDAQSAAVAAAADSQALFDPTGTPALLPFPSTLVYTGTEDGTINIPVADPTAIADPQVALNQMDGFSPISPIVTPMNRALDQASLQVGTTIHVLEVEASIAQGFAPTGVVGPLSAAQMVAVATPGNLVLQPTAPLRPNATYLVLLTNGITDAEGASLARSLTYSLLAGPTDLTDPSTAGLQAVTRAHLAVADNIGVGSDNVVLSWTFNVQSIRETLQAVKDNSVAQTFVAAQLGGATTQTLNPAAAGKADMWIGTLDLPYYQTAPGDNGAADALGGFWTGPQGSFLTANNPMPEQTSVQTVPVLISVPNAASAVGATMPGAGWPVAIFQHGITQDRTNMLAIADAMADAGFAVVAIDMPMHGITVAENPLNANVTAFPNDVERHFGIDVQNNENPLDFSPDNVIDSSGAHFYQLTNLPNSRDNLRQAVADLFILSASLGGVLQANPEDPAIAFDTSRKAFIGHSLGGIVGGVFGSYDTTINSATLAMPGSGIARLLANSGSFGPTINAGLAANGAPEGSAAYDQFLLATQTVIDSGDPANHMASLAATGTPVHLIEVIGDQTIPNAVEGAPFSGTEPMAALLGLQPVTATTNGGGLVRFSEGDHGSILSPAASLAATVEMQTQMATFAASNGTVLLISDSSVIAGAPQ